MWDHLIFSELTVGGHVFRDVGKSLQNDRNIFLKLLTNGMSAFEQFFFQKQNFQFWQFLKLDRFWVICFLYNHLKTLERLYSQSCCRIVYFCHFNDSNPLLNFDNLIDSFDVLLSNYKLLDSGKPQQTRSSRALICFDDKIPVQNSPEKT